MSAENDTRNEKSRERWTLKKWWKGECHSLDQSKNGSFFSPLLKGTKGGD